LPGRSPPFAKGGTQGGFSIAGEEYRQDVMYFEGFIVKRPICSVRTYGCAIYLIRSRTVFVRVRYPGVAQSVRRRLAYPGLQILHPYALKLEPDDPIFKSDDGIFEPEDALFELDGAIFSSDDGMLEPDGVKYELSDPMFESDGVVCAFEDGIPEKYISIFVTDPLKTVIVSR